MTTWRTLLPETRDPRHAAMEKRRWVDRQNGLVQHRRNCVHARPGQAQDVAADSARDFIFPRGWVAQRRFDASPLDSPVGGIYPCLGVYTVDGKAAGIYGRFSTKPLIDYSAVDAAVLVEDEI